MVTEIRLPPLGESISEGSVVQWLIEVGDVVLRDQDFVVVATDKAEQELPLPAGGTVLALLVSAGESVAVGGVIAVLGDAGERWERPSPRIPTPRVTPSVSRPAPVEPRQRERAFREAGDHKLFVSPVVRRLVREHDVDLGLIAGSGAKGRVTRRDLEAFLASGGANTGFAGPRGGYRPGMSMPFGGFARRLAIPFDPATPSRHAPELMEGDTVRDLSRLGRVMAEHMAYTWWRAPHVSALVEVDMARISENRRTHRARFLAETGGKLSFTHYVAWAAADVLGRHPGFNASFTDRYQIIEHRAVNLGVAVARPGGGLVVPVVRDAASMSLRQLAAALEQKIERARGDKLSQSDLSGGTFTVTNVGSNGNLASMPLISQPQVAILAVGLIKKRVVVVTDSEGHDEMAIRPMMYMTLTYDHRANDGAASGRFLRELRKTLEQWSAEP